MNDTVRRLLPLVILLALLAGMLVPKYVTQRTCQRFGQPLFDHPLLEGAELVVTDADKDDAGVVTAAMILKTDYSTEELEAFYADLDCQPVKEGQTVHLLIKPLTETDLAALEKAGVYDPGAAYQFVYVTSK